MKNRTATGNLVKATNGKQNGQANRAPKLRVEDPGATLKLPYDVDKAWVEVEADENWGYFPNLLIGDSLGHYYLAYRKGTGSVSGETHPSMVRENVRRVKASEAITWFMHIQEISKGFTSVPQTLMDRAMEVFEALEASRPS